MIKETFFLVAISLFSCGPMEASGTTEVSKSIVVNAPVAVAWRAVQQERTADPSCRRVIVSNGPDYVMEEDFDKMPVIGKATCRYSEHESGDRKLEYKMISSDKLVAFEGAWLLSSCDGGKQTVVTLTSFADTGLKVPFASRMTKESTAKGVNKRLDQFQRRVSSLSNSVATARID